MKQIAVLITTILIMVFSSCNHQSEEVRQSALNHFTQVYEADGSSKIDTIIFLSASIPSMILAGDETTEILDEKIKKLGSTLFLIAFTGSKDDFQENEEEYTALLKKSFAPFKQYVDSVDKIKTPKQNLALVQAHNKETKEISKCVYILSNNPECPITDSIISSGSVKRRIEYCGVADLSVEKILESTTKELDSIPKAKAKKKSPVFKFLLE